MATVEQILNSELADPAFSYRPGAANPVGADMTFTRSTDAWVFTPQQNFVKRGADTPRIRGADASILLETQADQILSSPDDLNSQWNGLNMNVTGGVGTVFGQSYGTARETTADGRHRLRNSGFTTSTGAEVNSNILFRPVGRDYFNISLSCRDGNNNNVYGPEISIDASATDPDQWSASFVAPNNSTLYIAKVESLWRDWAMAKMGARLDAGIYGYNLNVKMKQDPSTASYPGDTSKGVDVIVGNIVDGRISPADPIFQQGVKNKNSLQFTIPTEDWNNKEGAYYMEFTPRFSHGQGYPRIFNNGLAEIYVQPESTPFTVLALDRANNNQSVGSPVGADAYVKNKLLVTFRDDGSWAIALGGQQNFESNGHDGAFLNRPSPGSFLRSGQPSSMVLHDFRYIPSWVSTTTRKVATS